MCPIHCKMKHTDASGILNIRCFPHVVNLACQAFLAELKKNPTQPVLDSHGDTGYDKLELWKYLETYASALTGDPVGRVRSVVAACRASGQRRQGLKATIIEGNVSKRWIGKLPDGADTLPVVQLLRDCETHWSSSHLMVERVILLYPVHAPCYLLS